MADRPRQQLLKSDLLPVPTGMNTADPAVALGPEDAAYIVNMVLSDRGLKPRPGTYEWATHVGSGDVRTIIPFGGSIAENDRLFACTQAGIWDCTAGGASPTMVYAFGTQTSDSGYGSSVVMTTPAGRYLIYADEVNGFLIYNEGTGTWGTGSITTGGESVTEGSLNAVVQWKARLWFVEAGTSNAWYLPTSSISGLATKFDFGPFFQYGGTLLGLYRQTIDSGIGSDDNLVAISTSGDVVIFVGTDPASNFAIKGTYNLGGVPIGRRVAISHGGDLLILTNMGIINLSSLPTGVLMTPDTYETKKIRPIYMEKMVATSGLHGWQMAWHPEDNFLLVNVPPIPGMAQEQLAMSSAKKGWSRFSGVDICSMEVWQRQMFIGTHDGRVMKMTGYVDNVQLGGITTNAKAVEWKVLGAFNGLQSARQKMLRMIQVFMITHGVAPTVAPIVNFNFDISEPSGSLAGSLPQGNTWDNSLWDIDVWGTDTGTYNPILGADGIGVSVAVGVHGQSIDYTVLTGWVIHWETGGLL
jgi:hypothetical protein